MCELFGSLWSDNQNAFVFFQTRGADKCNRLFPK